MSKWGDAKLRGGLGVSGASRKDPRKFIVWAQSFSQNFGTYLALLTNFGHSRPS